MRRRTLLATAGVLVSAGCSALQGGDGTDTATDTDTQSETDTAAPTDTTTAPSGTDTLSEPAPTTGTESPTATDTTTEPEETATPNRAEREAAREIDRARTKLSEALTEYVAFAPSGTSDPTILSVDASVNVTIADVTNPVSEARVSLDRVTDRASSEQQATVEALRGVATFLDRGVRCQAKLYDAYQDFTFVVDRLYAENTGGVPDEIANIRDETADARGFFDTLTAESDAGDTTAFDDLDEATYADKVGQFEAELDAFPTVADGLTAFRRGLETFLEAAENYLGGDYREPRETFPEAADDFRTASQTLSAVSAPPSIADTVADLVEVAEAIAPACDDLAEASRAGFTGDSSDREDAFEAAQAHLESSDVAVENFDTIEELVEE
jgi:hypothetical protein